MRLVPMMIILLMLQVAIFVFDHTADYSQPSYFQANESAQTSNGTAVTGAVATSSGAWNFFFDPVNWNDNSFMTLLMTGLIVGTAVSIGASLIFRSDLTILFPVYVMIMGFGLIPIMNLWNIINREIGTFGCEGGICGPAALVAAVVCAPFALYWVFVTTEWWSGRPTN